MMRHSTARGLPAQRCLRRSIERYASLLYILDRTPLFFALELVYGMSDPLSDNLACYEDFEPLGHRLLEAVAGTDLLELECAIQKIQQVRDLRPVSCSRPNSWDQSRLLISVADV